MPSSKHPLLLAAYSKLTLQCKGSFYWGGLTSGKALRPRVWMWDFFLPGLKTGSWFRKGPFCMDCMVWRPAQLYFLWYLQGHSWWPRHTDMSVFAVRNTAHSQVPSPRSGPRRHIGMSAACLAAGLGIQELALETGGRLWHSRPSARLAAPTGDRPVRPGYVKKSWSRDILDKLCINIYNWDIPSISHGHK